METTHQIPLRNYQQIKKSTQVSFWISAVTNRSVVYAMMTDRKQNAQAMRILVDRLADYYQLPKRATSWMAIHNPQDDSPWPELLGWLVTMADMETVYTHVNTSEKYGFLCACGNTPDKQGAYHCDSEGNALEDAGDDYPGKLYRCDKCGIVFEGDSGKIVKQAAEVK